MGFLNHIAPRFLALMASSMVLASTPYAQTAALKSDTSSAVAPPYSSAFKGYKPYTDEPVVNWKAANDATAQIGGWREYARQAKQPENTPASTSKAGEMMPEPIGKAKP